MVDVNKLYKMIKVMGRMDLKSLSQRFPSETMESLKNIVENTEGLEIVGSFVRINEDIVKVNIDKPPITQETLAETLSNESVETEEILTSEETSLEEFEIEEETEEIEEEILEEEMLAEVEEETVQEEMLVQEDEMAEDLNIIKNITATGESYLDPSLSQQSSVKSYAQVKNSVSPTGATIKSFNSENIIELRDVSKKKSTKVGNDLSFDNIINLINKYNEKMEEELQLLMGDIESREEDAIYKYLTDRYIVEPYKEYDNATIVSQYDKTTNSPRGYAVITKDFTGELFKQLDSLFEHDMVFIYYTNENHVGIPDTMKEFFLRSTEAILNEYMLDFELKKTTVELAQIGRVDTGEIIK